MRNKIEEDYGFAGSDEITRQGGSVAGRDDLSKIDIVDFDKKQITIE